MVAPRGIEKLSTNPLNDRTSNIDQMIRHKKSTNRRPGCQLWDSSKTTFTQVERQSSNRRPGFHEQRFSGLHSCCQQPPFVQRNHSYLAGILSFIVQIFCTQDNPCILCPINMTTVTIRTKLKISPIYRGEPQPCKPLAHSSAPSDPQPRTPYDHTIRQKKFLNILRKKLAIITSETPKRLISWMTHLMRSRTGLCKESMNDVYRLPSCRL